VSFGWFIPARISDVSPHHCESPSRYHCEEEEVEDREPTVHIRLTCFTFLNLHGNRSCSSFGVKWPMFSTPTWGPILVPVIQWAVLLGRWRTGPLRPLIFGGHS
jgi:hypothetical protein